MTVLTADRRRRIEPSEELAEARSNTQAVIHVIEAVGKHTTTSAVIDAALHAVRSAFGLDYGACWLIDKRLQATSFAAEAGNLGPAYDEINRTNHYEKGKGITGRTWATRDLIFIPDLSTIPESQLVDTARAAGAVSALSFPFIGHDEVIGVLFFLSFRHMSPSQDRLDTLRNIGRLVGQAFANIQDVEREQEQQRELREAVRSLLAVVETARRGDLTAEVPSLGDDAIGQIARGLAALLANFQGSIRGISETAATVTRSAQRLSETGDRMVEQCDASSSGIGEATVASREVSENIGGVARGATEMLESIREILRGATQASAAVRGAVLEAGDAQQKLSRLSSSSVEIGQAVKVIGAIANQTKLLALNASIEAARAGAAGAGFNVVANEVKQLARKTSLATDEITEKIQSVREAAQEAVASIRSIAKVVGEVSGMSETIVSTVEEQSKITAQIGEFASTAATGSAAVAAKMTEIAEVAQQAKNGAVETQDAATSLTQMAVELQGLVARFKVD
jgi:methyl-accepting chemotaxis protein